MDYEKLHKDTIAKLQEMVNSGKITVDIARGICADFVPESEGERIRKDIIVLIKDWWDRVNKDNISTKEQMLAWLEKQEACDEIKGKCGELNSVASKPIEFGLCESWSDEETRLKLLFFIQTVGAAKLPLTSVNRYVDWIENQGKKIVAIENFDTEFEKQVSCLIASSMNKEHEYTEAFVKWASEALLNYAKHELEKQDEQNFYASETMNDKGDFDNGFTRMIEKGQKPTEWTEEDDSHIYSITEKLKGKFEKSTVITKFSLKEDLSWIKSLKDKIQPQPMQEWSYNDAIIIETIIQEIEKIPSEKFIDNAKCRCLDWLKYRTKSLRPQWKPSDDIIMYLERAIEEESRPKDFQIALNNLLKQLKKLREE